MEHKFNYNWKLSEANFTKDKGKVFSCFACGGGSTMGYKLAGFDVIGCNEIDPRMNKCYVENHHPKYNYLCDIREMVRSQDLPEDLYELDVLDGSPPCSNFSMVGNREKDWGKKKKFREGQQEQVLDTLFFDFIALAKKLQPKVVIAENVKGLLLGSAMEYVRKIYDGFNDAGYYCQHFLLDASKMGLPQKRQRCFFLCLRKDLAEPFLVPINFFESQPLIDMSFSMDEIPYREIKDREGRALSANMIKIWENREEGDKCMCEASLRLKNKKEYFSQSYAYEDKVLPTITAHEDCIVKYSLPQYLSCKEVCLASSFPLDYKFMDNKPHYMCGMSVPPIMMAQVVSRVYEQWLSKIKK